MNEAGTYGELRENHERSWDIRGTAGESRKAGTYGELRENHERSWDIRGQTGNIKQ
jgi:hypothetical protein